MKPVPRFVRLALLIAPASPLALAGPGCQSSDAKPTTKPAMTANMPVAPTTMPGATHTMIKDEAYYKSSPAQASPPDGTLKAGTQVKVMVPGGSYTKVEIGNQMSVWVPTASLQPTSN